MNELEFEINLLRKMSLSISARINEELQYSMWYVIEKEVKRNTRDKVLIQTRSLSRTPRLPISDFLYQSQRAIL